MIGYNFFKYANIIWKVNQNAILPLSSPKVLNNFTEDKAKVILNNSNCFFVRWEFSVGLNKETCWWHIVREEKIEIENLSSNTKSKLRRGLKRYRITELTRTEIEKEGFKVYEDAFTRYNTYEKKFSFDKFNKAIKLFPNNTEFWGARCVDSGNLVAFGEIFTEENYCFFHSLWFTPNALKNYVAYAFIFDVTNHYLSRGFLYISNGNRNLSHETNIHEFLEKKFGFHKSYFGLNIVYKNWFFCFVKILYPLRNLISAVKLNIFKKIYIVLQQEEIRKSTNSLKN